MDTVIYETPAEILPSELNESLRRLALRVEINWAPKALIELSPQQAQELKYLCNKLEAYIIYLQLEASFEKSQNSTQRDALCKINAIIGIYNTQTKDLKEHQIKKSRRDKVFQWFKKYRS